ncbi:MAG TPA: lasso peptide biosynthesis B2 protein [Planctomycetes bacterium]|nr:lasso peptide biosynthesis B2 protein [Planctomycetota bacterium]
MGRAPDRGLGLWRKRAWTLRALVLLALVRLGLAVLPFRIVRRVQQRAARVRRAPCPDSWVPTLARSVERAARRLPGEETCLAQAMVGQILLARAGHPSEIKIGVARPPAEGDPKGRKLLAHAWLEARGVALIGEPEPGRYTELTTR